MAFGRDRLTGDAAEKGLARSAVLWLAIGSAGAMLVFLGWLCLVAFGVLN
jgi:hypothetical protein